MPTTTMSMFPWQRAEIEIAVTVRNCLHDDAVHPCGVRLFQSHLNASRYRRFAYGIHHLAVIPVLFALTCPAVSVGFKRNWPLPSATIEAQALKSMFKSTLWPQSPAAAHRQSGPAEFSVRYWPGCSAGARECSNLLARHS